MKSNPISTTDQSRILLEPYCGKRITVVAIYDRTHIKTMRDQTKTERSLVQCVELEDGTFLCDHVWVIHSANISHLELLRGTKIKFTAIVMDYLKKDHLLRAYRDFGLIHPTRIEVLKEHVELPDTSKEDEELMNQPETKPQPVKQGFHLDPNNADIATQDGEEFITVHEIGRRLGGVPANTILFHLDRVYIPRMQLRSRDVEPNFEYKNRPPGAAAGFYKTSTVMKALEGYQYQPRPKKEQPVVSSNGVHPTPDPSAPPVETFVKGEVAAPPRPTKPDRISLLQELQRLVEVYGWAEITKAVEYLTK